MINKYEDIKRINACFIESNQIENNEEDTFFDCSQDENHCEFHDCLEEPLNHKAFHLSVDYQYLANKVRGSQNKVKFLRTYQVDELLTALEWSQLIGEQEPFSTLAMAVTTSQKYHKLEQIQPYLIYKPIEVIKKHWKQLHNGPQLS